MLQKTATIYLQKQYMSMEAMKIIMLLQYVYKNCLVTYVAKDDVTGLIKDKKPHSYFVCEPHTLAATDKRVLQSTTDVKNKVPNYTENIASNVDVLMRYEHNRSFVTEAELSTFRTYHTLAYGVLTGYIAGDDLHVGLLSIKKLYDLLVDTVDYKVTLTPPVSSVNELQFNTS